MNTNAPISLSSEEVNLILDGLTAIEGSAKRSMADWVARGIGTKPIEELKDKMDRTNEFITRTRELKKKLGELYGK